MNTSVLTPMLIGLIVGSALGGSVLRPLAKNVGKILNATFRNSFLVCLFSTAINLIIWNIFWQDAIKMGFFGLFIMNFIILSISYIVIGKFIWKCSWMQSIKANSIWILLYAFLMGYLLNKVSSMI